MWLPQALSWVLTTYCQGRCPDYYFRCDSHSHCSGLAYLYLLHNDDSCHGAYIDQNWDTCLCVTCMVYLCVSASWSFANRASPWFRSYGYPYAPSRHEICQWAVENGYLRGGTRFGNMLHVPEGKEEPLCAAAHCALIMPQGALCTS